MHAKLPAQHSAADTQRLAEPKQTDIPQQVGETKSSAKREGMMALHALNGKVHSNATVCHDDGHDDVKVVFCPF